MWIRLKRWWFAEPRSESCRSCDILEHQLEVERARVSQLLDKLSGSKPIHDELEEEKELKPLQTGRRFIPFAVRQQMMEAQDNKTLEVLKERWAEIHNPIITTRGAEQPENNSIEELEREIIGATGSN